VCAQSSSLERKAESPGRTEICGDRFIPGQKSVGFGELYQLTFHYHISPPICLQIVPIIVFVREFYRDQSAHWLAARYMCLCKSDQQQERLDL
jgi:hypothetical protein